MSDLLTKKVKNVKAYEFQDIGPCFVCCSSNQLWVTGGG